MYHKEHKRDKFDYAVAGIFICSIIVSLSHTVELYKTAGFDVPVNWLNAITEKWIGKDFFTLAHFAMIAAEAAFTIGLWGLYEAFKKTRSFPGWRYGWTWSMFFGGLVIIGWSNIGGTLGYNYLFGDPVKGYILGLSIPYFVLNAVLVNFSRSQPDEVTEQQTNEQPKWKRLINTYKEIKEELVTPTEHNKSTEQKNVKQESLIEQKREMNINQNKFAEQVSNEQPEADITEQNEIEQLSETNRTTQIEQRGNKQGSGIDQENEASEQDDHTEQIELVKKPNIEQETVTKQIEQDDHTVQNEPKQSNIEQGIVTEQTEQMNKPNKPKRQTKKPNSLYVVRSNKAPSKTEQAFQYVVSLIEQNKTFTVREVAEAVGCSPATVQTAINRVRKQA